MKVGDVVHMKTKNTCMTIQEIKDNNVLCYWFDTNNHLNKEWFTMESLVIVKKERVDW